MKRLLTALICITIMLITQGSGCGGEKATSPSNSKWSVNGMYYYPKTVARNGTNQILCEDDKGNSLQLFFSTLPTVSGTQYMVVGEDKAAHGTLASNEVAVEVNMGASDVYLSINETPAGTPKPTVYINSGKISVDMGTCRTIHLVNGVATDTIRVTSTISE